MTEETEQAAPAPEPEAPEREITFNGRPIWVRLPRPEAILVWKRTLTQLQGADVSGWNGHQVMAALERAQKIVYALIVHDVDKDWLDNAMLEADLGLIEVSSIIQLTIEAFQADDNREARRASAKAKPKKASRKKAPR